MARSKPETYNIYNKPKGNKPKTIYFTMNDKSKHHIDYNGNNQAIFKKDCPNTCAKVNIIGDEEVYYIKFGPHGDMLNFKDVYEAPNPAKKEHGLDSWRYIKVNQRCFDHYLAFLRTGNTARLQMARRELI